MSYSGLLRASLISPDYTDPINSIQDVVDSGLPWKVVLYGTTYERMYEAHTEEPYVTYWRDKQAVPFNDFPIDTVGRIIFCKDLNIL